MVNKIALLGASGFVGKNVGAMLTNEKFQFLPVTRSHGYDLRKLDDNIKFIKESNCTHIINCAAHVGSLKYVTENAADIISDNTSMLLAMYAAIQQTNPSIIVIQPIANCAYPANALVYKEDEFWDGPIHPSVLSYGITRRLMASLATCYHMQYGIQSINLIAPNMYGEFDSTDPNKAHALNALVSKFVKAIATNQEKVEIWGSGIAIREWLYAKDFATIVKLVLKDTSKPDYKNPINIAQEYGLSVSELIGEILKCVPYIGEIYYNPNMPDGALRKVMSKKIFEKSFPNFKFTNFTEGIKKTAAYYQSVYPY